MTTFTIENGNYQLSQVNTADKLISLIHEVVGDSLTELSQNKLNEILIAIIKLIPTTSGTTTVDMSYTGNVLTVTVNGVSASVNINPTGIIYQYNAGFGMYVRATSVGIAFNYTLGLGTLVIPAGVKLLSCRLHGTPGYLDVDNSFAIKFEGYTGISDEFDIYPPDVQLYDRIFGNAPTDIIPWTYVYNASPQPQVSAVGLSTLTIKFINLDAYLNWGIKISF